MHHELGVYPDPDPVAKAAAEYVATTARAAVASLILADAAAAGEKG